MKKEDLSSSHLGKKVTFNDEMWNNEMKAFSTYKNFGTIDSLLVDINYGAYGYSVKLFGRENIYHFILINSDTQTKTSKLVGSDLSELEFIP